VHLLIDLVLIRVKDLTDDPLMTLPLVLCERLPHYLHILLLNKLLLKALFFILFTETRIDRSRLFFNIEKRPFESLGEYQPFKRL
jgi:hypothetical protein